MPNYPDTPAFPFSAVNQAYAYKITLTPFERIEIAISFIGHDTGCGVLLHERTALSAPPIETPITHELANSPENFIWKEESKDTPRELWFSAWTYHGTGPGTIGSPGWYQVPQTASLPFDPVYGGEVHYSATGSVHGPTTINVIIKCFSVAH